MKRKRFFAVMALLMTAFIFYNSAKPAVESAKSSGIIVEKVLAVLAHFGVRMDFYVLDNLIRKMAHFAEFFVQSVFIANSFSGRYRNRIVYILFLGLLTACTDEYIQLFFEGRGGMVRDVFIDFGGTAAGMAICGIFRKRR